MTEFRPPNYAKMTQFGPFSQKMTYFDQIDQLITFFTKFLSINLTEIIFRNFKGKNNLTSFAKFWHMTSFWPQNITKF